MVLKRTTHDDVPSCFSVEYVLQNASVSEKISLLSGRDFWHTNPLPAFNVPSVRVSDGPNGVRGTKFVDGVPAACLPCGTGLAATWDQDLLYKAGTLIGDEGIAKGAHCWLGPTSMAEDPYATGKLAAAYIKGVQSTGVVSVIKHWLANDQEHERVGVNVVASERALREIHMLPFQIALSDAAPGGVMACYNKVNGKHVSENRDFLDALLREEWQWKGLIMSDWFGTYSTTEAVNAGLDLEIPGPTRQRGQLLDLAVSTRKVSRSTIDIRARNVLEFVQRCTKAPVAAEEGGRDFPEDRQLNRKLAGDSVVLLKNEGGQLPLKRPFKSIALIGPNMKTTSFCGGGSAHLQPYYTVSPYEGIVAQLPPDVEVRYEVGASANGWNPLLQGDMITTPEGAPGMRMRFYSQGPSVPDREIKNESHLPVSSRLLMGYSHPKLENHFYASVEGDLVIQETGLFEFGLAVYGSARLYQSDTFFFGKGTIEEKAQMHLVRGQKYRITIEYEIAPSSKLVKPGVVNFGGGAGRVGLASAVDPEIGIQKAVSAALQSDVTILCVGMTRDQESEGFDRAHMDLPGSLPQLASAVLAAVPDTIVITQSGTPFSMLWAESAKTHVHAWLAGSETGNGIADVLFGATCPSGKLPLSFPRRIQDTPTFLNFGSERGRVIYGEDIYVGYRYYEKVDRDVLYPFGHGLSYTTFTYDKLNVTSSDVSFDITNSASVPGAEVSQLYIAVDEATSSIQRAKKELKAIWNMPVLLGPSLGPAVGAYVSRGLGWRWNFWLLIIMTGAVLVVCAFIQKETHPPTLQRKKLKALQIERHTEELPPATPHRQLIKRSLARPLKMLFLSPIIFGLSFLTAIAYGTLYLLFTTVSETFITKYGIVTNVGLIYLGFGFGQIVGLILFGMVSDPILRRMARGGELKPEYRLPLMIPCSAIIPVGLLVYGWTTEYGVFWFVPVIGTFMIGFGMITVFPSVSTYLVDAFPTYAASATAANTVLRSVGGALLPLAGPKMFHAIGQGWCGCIAGHDQHDCYIIQIWGTPKNRSKV
ncbi:beta-glucosidase K [Fusarium subglutinans]|uniref:beta-glucosidase n=1 Tax=Gibberella subglutinans TaxID=42677 RepID=A0A8H5L8M2_GIBSU|nr:beta-glucosidase K [Fusarium subglutinans]KAF5587008.1 beta-glucosidase K [Fusarium subglutinans]